MQERLSTNLVEVEQEERLTLLKAKKLFVLSFRFSQGDSDLQGDIFEYLSVIRPLWHMSDEFRDKLEEVVKSPIKKNIKPSGSLILHKEILDFELDSGIKYEAKEMQNYLNVNYGSNKDFVLANVTEKIIDRDFLFIVSRKGRPRSRMSEYTKFNPELDRSISHICFYGIEGNPTGEEEYDQMFEGVREVALRIMRGEAVFTEEARNITAEKQRKLKAVIDKYVQTHPKSSPKLKSLGLLSANAA